MVVFNLEELDEWIYDGDRVGWIFGLEPEEGASQFSGRDVASATRVSDPGSILFLVQLGP